MPATDDEMLRLVDNLVADFVAPIQLEDLIWEDGTKPTVEELRTALLMYGYIMRNRRKPPGQRKAMRLLRSLLNPRQRQMLRSHRYFYVTSKSGATFRFNPRVGHTDRVKKHGKYWFRTSTFCLHDSDGLNAMPPADLVVAHLLLIAADEQAFLKMANEHQVNSDLWNGEYLRRMRRRHTDAAEIASPEAAGVGDPEDSYGDLEATWDFALSLECGSGMARE